MGPLVVLRSGLALASDRWPASSPPARVRSSSSRRSFIEPALSGLRFRPVPA
jgi:hypothetical protein